jgi:hypothetical protein
MPACHKHHSATCSAPERTRTCTASERNSSLSERNSTATVADAQRAQPKSPRAQEPNLRKRQSKQKALETRCFEHNQERKRAKKGYLNIKDDAHDGLEEASEDRVEAEGPAGRAEARVHPRWL